jgi:hypothetical protein
MWLLVLVLVGDFQDAQCVEFSWQEKDHDTARQQQLR